MYFILDILPSKSRFGSRPYGLMYAVAALVGRWALGALAVQIDCAILISCAGAFLMLMDTTFAFLRVYHIPRFLKVGHFLFFLMCSVCLASQAGQIYTSVFFLSKLTFQTLPQLQVSYAFI